MLLDYCYLSYNNPSIQRNKYIIQKYKRIKRVQYIGGVIIVIVSLQCKIFFLIVLYDYYSSFKLFIHSYSILFFCNLSLFKSALIFLLLQISRVVQMFGELHGSFCIKNESRYFLIFISFILQSTSLKKYISYKQHQHQTISIQFYNLRVIDFLLMIGSKNSAFMKQYYLLIINFFIVMEKEKYAQQNIQQLSGSLFYNSIHLPQNCLICSFKKKMYKQIIQIIKIFIQQLNDCVKNIIINLLKNIMKFLLYFVLVASVFAELGIDLSKLVSSETFQCIKNDGISYAIIRGYSPDGSIDPNAIFSLSNAKTAGLYTDIYMAPCRGNNATNQVDDMMNGIPSSLYGMVWINIEPNNSTGCSWFGHDLASNCAFATELVNAVKARGKNAGIYSYNSEYTLIMGGTHQCPGLSTQQVWYSHTNTNPSFLDWGVLKFGQWSTPNMKQYQSQASICGVSVNRNFS